MKTFLKSSWSISPLPLSPFKTERERGRERGRGREREGGSFWVFSRLREVVPYFTKLHSFRIHFVPCAPTTMPRSLFFLFWPPLFLHLLPSASRNYLPPPPSSPGIGELRTQKLKSHLMRIQVLPLKPGVGQYTAMHITLTARVFFVANFYPSGPFTNIFSKTSPEFILC